MIYIEDLKKILENSQLEQLRVNTLIEDIQKAIERYHQSAPVKSDSELANAENDNKDANESPGKSSFPGLSNVVRDFLSANSDTYFTPKELTTTLKNTVFTDADTEKLLANVRSVLSGQKKLGKIACEKINGVSKYKWVSQCIGFNDERSSKYNL